jgi:hypothetical protein
MYQAAFSGNAAFFMPGYEVIRAIPNKRKPIKIVSLEE